MNSESIKNQVNKINEWDYEEELQQLQILGADIEIYRKRGLDHAQLEQVRLGLEADIDVDTYANPEIPWFQMEEMRLGLIAGIDLKKYSQCGFDWMQLSEVRLGLEHDIDVSQYADAKYVSQQMHEIRIGLENEIDVSKYADADYDWFQMEEIRKGLERGADITAYANKSYDYLTMRQIRKAMEKGIDLIPYVQKGYKPELLLQIRRCLISNIMPGGYLELGYDADQLEQIRIAFEKNIDLGPYLTADLIGSQLEEIIKGIEVGIDVSLYGKSDYNWQQMREIRLGLENRIDVSAYLKPLFTYLQMQEIRKGLEAGFDVGSYVKLMYSLTDMKRIREKMMQDEENGITVLAEIPKEEFASSFVTISSDGMLAELDLAEPSGKGKYTEADILDILKSQGVILGIDREVIKQMIEKELYSQKVTIARGQKAIPGQDGYYNFLFRTELPTQPKIMPDGSVDYMNMDYFEEVKQGQKLAVYVPATVGKGGYTVSGKIMIARKGKEKPVLRGQGFILLEDNCTYVSMLNGKIDVDEYRMNISKLHIVDGDVTYTTGNIKFDGDLLIRGCVRSGVTLQAGGNIVVEGNVESANLFAEGDILVKKGVQSGGVGKIKAKGAVTGNFFESANIEAGLDIHANYVLNCEISTKEKVFISGRKGILVGGVTRAVQGVEVFDLGNSAELSTVIEAGLTKQFFEKYNEIEKNIIKTQSEVRIFQEGLLKFETTYTKEQLASISVYDKIKSACAMKLEEMSQLLTQKDGYEQEMEQMSQAKVIVRGRVYAGAHIVIDRIPLRITETVPNVTFRHIEDRVAIFRN